MAVNIESLRVTAEKLREAESPYKSAGDWHGLGIGAMATVVEESAAEIERLRKIEAAARMLSDSLNGGFIACRRCGDQEDTTDLDFAEELREALGPTVPADKIG